MCVVCVASHSPITTHNPELPSEGWRCPGCQNASKVVPSVYKCYCGKVTNPQPRSKGELTVPHSCGDLCLKKLSVAPESTCKHKCRLLCHPGPCPPCPVVVTRNCPCGKKVYQVRCSKSRELPSCGSVCGKRLECGKHHCNEDCHSGLTSVHVNSLLRFTRFVNTWLTVVSFQLLPFSTLAFPFLPPPSPLPLISSPPPSLSSPLLFPHSSPFSPPLFLSPSLLPSSSSLPKVPAPPALCPSPRPAIVGKLLPGRCTVVNQANSTSLVEQFATGTLFTIIVTSIYLTENVIL